jgi:L-fuconolactonase
MPCTEHAKPQGHTIPRVKVVLAKAALYQFKATSTYPLWQAAEELGVAVNLLANFEHLATVAELAARFATVPIVVDHIAHPALPFDAAAARPLFALARFPNIRIKLSGFYYFSGQPFPYADCEGLMAAVREHLGPHRVLWGSDFPHALLKARYARAVAAAERFVSFLGADSREPVLGDNAPHLYWPDAAPCRGAQA